ncbi:MAG: PAS domain S-box protein [Bacteroidia bacterium]|nr:PAS domain S-box protein [Bacteroidia bacterium]
MNILKKLGSPFKDQLRLFRFLCILCAVIFPGFALATSGKLEDPFILRAILGGSFLLVFALSYLSKRIRDNFAVFFSWVIFLPTLWWSYLVFVNDLTPDLRSSTFIIIFAVSLTLANRRMMFIYSVFCLVVFGMAGFFIEKPLTNPGMYLMLIGILLLIANVALGYRIHYREILERSHTRIRTIQDGVFKSGSDGFLISDLNGKIIELNQKVIAIWKQSGIPADWRGKAVSEFIRWEHGKEPAELAARANQILYDPNEILDGEISMVDETYFRVRSQPLAEGNQSVCRLWNFIDITSQKEKERSLMQVEELLRGQNDLLIRYLGEKEVTRAILDKLFQEITRSTSQLLALDSASIWLMREEGKALHCVCRYDAAEDNFSQTGRLPLEEDPGYFKALTEIRIIAVNDAEQVKVPEVFLAPLHGKAPLSFIHVPVWRSGQVRGILTLEARSAARNWSLIEKQYATSHADLIAMGKDRFEKQESEALLEKTANLLNTLFEASEMAILVANPERKVIDWNEKYLEIWKMSADFLRDATYEELMAHCGNLLKNDEEYYDQTRNVAEFTNQDYYVVLEFKDGRYVERFSKSIQIRGSQVARAIFYLDITEKKMREKELVTRNFELDSFVYRASHDLKAPLNSIMGLISIIKDEDSLEGALRYIQLMDRSVSKLDSFIRQLTEFSQNTRLEIENVPIQFEEILNEAVENLRYMDEAEKVDLERNIRQKGEFLSDPMRLGIVLNNLVSNSVKYQDHKKPKATLKIEIETDEKEARLVIDDNGIGIPHEHLHRVFDLFFRASIQSTGTGLGLYITKSAIEYLGGSVRIESEPGVGTTFRIRIPNGGAGQGARQLKPEPNFAEG